MSDQALRITAAAAASHHDRPIPLGRELIERNIITPWQLFYALRCQRRWNATLAEILGSRGWVSETRLLSTMSHYESAQFIDLDREPPDIRLNGLLRPDFCLKHCVLPWAGVGGLLILAVGRPDRLAELRPHLPTEFARALIVIAREDQILAHVTARNTSHLTDFAETRLDQRFSSRGWDFRSPRQSILLAGLLSGIALISFSRPGDVLLTLTLLAMLSLVVSTSVKCATLFLHLMRRAPRPGPALPADARLPRFSMIVPLFREPEIAQALIARRTRLTYPRTLLDVVLVLEQKDTQTQETIARTRLPKWMRVVQVPAGSGLTTKPRALNYALNFCKGDIIGIWDAEDAPAPDQLEQVAQYFASADPDVACLQGVLDYYNPYTNWISRCFTLEYATWFRIILPGLTRMGLSIPLGGTTLFLRRHAIEHVGGWDAHNVTEDADLGYRLARFGYRTELVATVTAEEANCQAVAWIRQRSRWLKGYMVTYLVHMRDPRRLWRDLGPRRFIGFQLVFVTTMVHFLLAPMLWLFWFAAFGFAPPHIALFPASLVLVFAGFMVLAGILSATIALYSVLGQDRARLYPWVLTLEFYFPMATLAAYKALIELLIAPYYWDKTRHGTTAESQDARLPNSSQAP